MLNRKGNVMPALLVFGTLFLVIIAWVGFTTSNDSAVDEAKRFVKDIEDFNLAKASVKDAFYFMVNEARISSASKTGIEFETTFNSEIKKLAEQRREDWKDKTNLFGLLVNQEPESYALSKNEPNYVLRVKGVSVTTKNDNDELSGTYDFTITFNKDKIVKMEETAK